MQESTVVAVGWWTRRSRGSGVAASPSMSTLSGGIVGLDLRKNAIFSLSKNKPFGEYKHAYEFVL